MVRCFVLLVGLLAASGALAAGEKLDAEMRALEQARDLAGLQARIDRAGADELDSPEGWNWRAWLATANGDWGQAEALLDQGLALHPESATLELQRTALMVRGFNDVGNLGAMRLARRVRQGFERAVELDPDHVGARMGLIQYYLNAPRVAGGGEARANEHIERLKAQSLPAYLDIRAAQATARGEHEQALQYLEQALTLDDLAERRLSRGILLQMKGEHDQARADFLKIVEALPSHGAAWYQLGRTSVLAQAWIEDGQEAFHRYLSLPLWPGDPGHPAAWWRLGQLQLLGEDVDAARHSFERALELDAAFEPAAVALAELPS
ncbi:MAG: tetratricopeptide repeat protein [Wenzhouxiangella sp.]|nr:tetratricopeptide repeat protein [Wenzhouxiangella sp.]